MSPKSTTTLLIDKKSAFTLQLVSARMPAFADSIKSETMTDIQIYHNPRCSKSRQTLSLIEEKGITPEIVLYLENTPDAGTLKEIIAKLGIGARDLLRKGEQAYKDNQLKDESLSDDTLIDMMVAHPKLIERPIVIKGERAVLGRPPENVLDLL